MPVLRVLLFFREIFVLVLVSHGINVTNSIESITSINSIYRNTWAFIVVIFGPN